MWNALPTLHILITHDPVNAKHGISESEFKQKFSKAYGFLNHFEAFLENRPEYKRWGESGPFYELYRIGNIRLLTGKSFLESKRAHSLQLLSDRTKTTVFQKDQ